MIDTTNTNFRINRRWFEFYNRTVKFSDFLTLLTNTGIEPLLDQDGNIVTVQSTVTQDRYLTHTLPKLSNLAQTFQLPLTLEIQFRNTHESWKTLVKRHRVMTVITARAALPTQEET